MEPITSAATGGLTARQREIVRLVQDQGYASIEALARLFEVSAQSVRRDIIRLDELQLIQRFHGGAGLRENKVRLGYAQKKAVAAEGKEAIGRLVADIIPDGASLFLDVGTTVEAAAGHLRDREGLTVITPSLRTATIMSGRSGLTTIATGGTVHGADGSMVGEAAIASINRFKVDYAILACSGFDDDGTVMDFDLRKIEVKQAMLANCRQAILVTDAGKFERTALVRLAPLSAFAMIVTDHPPKPRFAELIEAAGGLLHIAGMIELART